MTYKKAFRAQSGVKKVQSLLSTTPSATPSPSSGNTASSPPFDKTFTLTFGDVAENHVGMQKIGSLASCGFTKTDLEAAEAWFTARGVVCEVIEMNALISDDALRESSDEAYILIARGAARVLCGAHDAADLMYAEQDALPKDTQAKMYGRVVTKHARHNLCFGEVAQQADFSAGRGSIVAYDTVPHLSRLRSTLHTAFGLKAQNLVVEGNYYFNKQCGIGYHGDAERRRVIGLRLGASLPLCFCWFHQNEAISTRQVFHLHHGDMYAFSEKATGYDWKRKIIPTLRHAAGAEKYITVPAKRMKL